LNPKPNILVYGYGNPGRQDDGLGVACADQIEEWLQHHDHADIDVDVQSNYQLNIEDALAIADKDVAIFVDASIEAINDFCFTRVHPSSDVAFSMHAVSPSFVLDLCQNLYDKRPDTYLLHIKGYEWEMKEELSGRAAQNLGKALAFLKDKLRKPDLLNKSIINP
jgi:hydrogenase maturation protease